MINTARAVDCRMWIKKVVGNVKGVYQLDLYMRVQPAEQVAKRQLGRIKIQVYVYLGMSRKRKYQALWERKAGTETRKEKTLLPGLPSPDFGEYDIRELSVIVNPFIRLA